MKVLKKGVSVSPDMRELNLLLFADDVSSFSDTVIQLQRQIDGIAKFSDTVGMKINLDKSKIMVFRNGGVIKQNEKWFLKGNQIETVSRYKYMGLHFSSKLSWSKSHEMLSLQAMKAINHILRVRRKVSIMKIQNLFKIFDSVMKPILCYGAQIWGYNVIKKIERVQIKFCKKICHLPENSCDAMALGECGRLPLCMSYMPICVKYWLKLIRMENTRYPKSCYEMLRQLDSVGRYTWATNIKNMLYLYGFGYVWIAQEFGNDENFISLFKQRIADCFTQQWFSNI